MLSKSRVRDGNCPPERSADLIVLADIPRSEQGPSFLRRSRNRLKRLQKALRQSRKRRSGPLVTLCWSAGLRTLEKM